MTTQSSVGVERLLKRQRGLVIAALALVTVVAWVYTLTGVGMGMTVWQMTESPWSFIGSGTPAMSMAGGDGMMDTAMASSGNPVSLSYVLVMLGMWWMMMIAMMLPSAAPTILLAAAINRRSKASSPPYGSAGWFTAGYLSIWLVFSALAVAIQLWFNRQGLLNPMMRGNSDTLTGILLLAAGIWQLTPIKQACLRHCRSPVQYLTTHRQPGNLGALRMGMGHGTYCFACCWFLMLLLFVGGVMNLYWIAGLALYVLLEKLLRGGVRFSYITGVLLVVTGAAVLVSSA